MLAAVGSSWQFEPGRTLAVGRNRIEIDFKARVLALEVDGDVLDFVV